METRQALRDSHGAQQQQADTALVTARIQTLNIRLDVACSKLTHLRNRQAALVQVQRQSLDGPEGKSWDDNSVYRRIIEQLSDVNEEARQAGAELDKLLFELSKHGLDLDRRTE